MVEWQLGVRLGGFQAARWVNSLSLDPQPGRGWQVLAQLDQPSELGGRPGAVRLLAGDIEAIGESLRGGCRIKQMPLLNAEQELTNTLGAFARLSGNDGRSQPWMSTQMAWAASASSSATDA